VVIGRMGTRDDGRVGRNVHLNRMHGTSDRYFGVKVAFVDTPYTSLPKNEKCVGCWSILAESLGMLSLHLHLRIWLRKWLRTCDLETSREPGICCPNLHFTTSQ
jgi:hypothetical protein